MAKAFLNTHIPKKKEKKLSWKKKQRLQRAETANVKKQSKKDPDDPTPDQSSVSPMSPDAALFNRNEYSKLTSPEMTTGDDNFPSRACN